MNFQIKNIKKLNIQNGDILFIPQETMSTQEIENMAKKMERVFPNIKAMIMITDEKVIQGIKVIHIGNFESKK